MPVCAGLVYALSALATRHLCAGESTVSLLAGSWLCLSFLGALGLIALMIFPQPVLPGSEGFVMRGWVWPMNQSWPYVLLQALGAVTGVFCLTRAYQIGEPSFVSVFEYSVMIFGPLYGWLVFQQALTPGQIVGIAVIIAAGAAIAAMPEGQEAPA